MAHTTEGISAPPFRKKNSLWRNRNFLLLWGGQTSSEVGSSIAQLAIPLAAVVLLEASTLEVGILSAITVLPYLLVSLPAGAIVDRTAKRRLMIWCDVGRLLLVGSIPLVTIPGLGLRLTLAHLFVVALLSGIMTVFFDIAYNSYVPVLLEKKDLVDANSKIGTTGAFAQFAGPSIGGALVGLIGPARTITFNAFSYAVSILSLLLIRRPEPEAGPRVAGRKMRHEIADGLRFVLEHSIIRKLVVCGATANLFGSILTAMSTVFLVRILQVEPGAVGVVWSVAAVGGMLGGVLAGWSAKRFGVARMIWVAPLVLGIPIFLQPLAQPGWGVLAYAVGYFFFSLQAVVFNVAQRSYRQAVTPPELLGRMNASIRFIAWGALPLGALLGGVLGSQIGVRETIWIGVAGTWLSGLWVFFSPLRTMRDIESGELPSSRDSAPES